MIYVASPYTHKNKEVMQQRYEDVSKFCYLAVQKGYFVYSPIVHWHPIAEKYGLPKAVEWWRQLNEDMLQVCKQLWILMLDEWEFSSGIKSEIIFAGRRRIQITYFTKGALKCIT